MLADECVNEPTREGEENPGGAYASGQDSRAQLRAGRQQQRAATNRTQAAKEICNRQNASVNTKMVELLRGAVVVCIWLSPTDSPPTAARPTCKSIVERELS
ncbi:uncharacterized protein H6S33_004003 [Morchella sextelata]|uniref:uncharacterized protein n=1 Tax=Morchella sextelata TaxID=1174677 RepID=UPI001D048821|nr:uncharacterized protein H6S33_004003 [Morchella sextelata]KAH0606342.1 hypothetical protein H6S33_004003 [Morchella sextelata]